LHPLRQLHLDYYARRIDHGHERGDEVTVTAAAPISDRFNQNLKVVDDLLAFAEGRGGAPELPAGYFGGTADVDDEQLRGAIRTWLRSFRDSIGLLHEFQAVEKATGGVAGARQMDEVAKASDILLRALARRLGSGP
jgi:hypothetical protein